MSVEVPGVVLYYFDGGWKILLLNPFIIIEQRGFVEPVLFSFLHIGQCPAS